MDYRDSAEEALFRDQLRAWLRANADIGRGGAESGESEFGVYHPEWHGRLYAGGWMGLSWPVEYGGRGLPAIYEAILNDEVGAFGAPDVPSVGFLGRALLGHGTEEQKRQYIPGLLDGTARWCQGFSEPGAGSDLASLSTRAVRDGDRYLLSGQKVWTSRAHLAENCLILARSDPEAPKHKGISCFIMKVDQPGVVVRQIKQITGSDDFCEVFLDEAVVPVENRIGAEGDGWRLAMETVAYERGPADIGFISRYLGIIQGLEDAYVEAQAKGEAGGLTAAALGRLYVSIESLRLRVMQSLSDRKAGHKPGPESSIDKLLMSEAEQLLGKALFDLNGTAAVLGEAPETIYRYLYSRASTIYGGTAQIQKGIIATRVLGLPIA